MKIKLGEIQKQLIVKILADKQSLLNELQRLGQRENDIVSVICESAGVKPVEGMRIEGDEIVFPEADSKPVEDKKVKKLNAK